MFICMHVSCILLVGINLILPKVAWIKGHYSLHVCIDFMYVWLWLQKDTWIKGPYLFIDFMYVWLLIIYLLIVSNICLLIFSLWFEDDYSLLVSLFSRNILIGHYGHIKTFNDITQVIYVSKNNVITINLFI